MKYKNKIHLFSLFPALLVCIGFLGFYSASATTSEDVKAMIEDALKDSDGNVTVTNNNITEGGEKQNQGNSSQENSSESTQSPSIVLNSPGQREIILNTNIKFSGKTSPGVIVNVTVSDEDLEKKFIQHQSSSKMGGNVTADKNGDWVYVPQFDFIPGEYSAVAYFSDPKLGSIQSERVFFTVVDGNGSSQWSIISKTWAWIGIVFLALAILSTAFLIFREKIFGKAREKNSLDFGPTVFDSAAGKNQTLTIIDYDGPGMGNHENLDELNEESLEAEKELIDVTKEVNESMKKFEELKRDVINKKEDKLDKNELGEEITSIENELLDVNKEVNEAVSKVEDMREEIVKKIKKRK